MVNAESEKLAVAMRFVDWFTSRGENYEHNMKVIDKHLKGLTVGSGSPALGAAGATTHSAGGGVGGLGAVASSAGSSSVHSYYIPGNRVAFVPNSEHAR